MVNAITILERIRAAKKTVVDKVPPTAIRKSKNPVSTDEGPIASHSITNKFRMSSKGEIYPKNPDTWKSYDAKILKLLSKLQHEAWANLTPGQRKARVAAAKMGRIAATILKSQSAKK